MILLKVAILLGVFSSNALGKVVCQLNIKMIHIYNSIYVYIINRKKPIRII